MILSSSASRTSLSLAVKIQGSYRWTKIVCLCKLSGVEILTPWWRVNCLPSQLSKQHENKSVDSTRWPRTLVTHCLLAWLIILILITVTKGIAKKTEEIKEEYKVECSPKCVPVVAGISVTNLAHQHHNVTHVRTHNCCTINMHINLHTQIYNHARMKIIMLYAYTKYTNISIRINIIMTMTIFVHYKHKICRVQK